MNDFGEEPDELNQEDAVLVRLVVEAIKFPQYQPMLDKQLALADAAGGWTDLVTAIKNVLAGERSLSQFDHLDDEDRRVILAIFRGLDDFSDLPDASNVVDPQKTGLKIATLVMAVRCGNTQAGQSLSEIVAMMNNMGGDMKHVSGAVAQIVDGERDADRLCSSTAQAGTRIVQRILEELRKRELE